MVEELLAQMIEVTSIGAAERRLAKPITVPRPKHLTGQGTRAAGDGIVYGDAYKQGIAALRATAGTVRQG